MRRALVITFLVVLLLSLFIVGVDAWGCEGHSLVTSIALRWLRANTKGKRNSVQHFFLEVLNRAISYDGRPFPKPRRISQDKPATLRKTLSTISCIPDDMRGSKEFDRFKNWHFGEVNCFPMQDGGECPSHLVSSSGEAKDYQASNNNNSATTAAAAGGGGGAGVHNKLKRLIQVLKEAAQNGRLGHGSPETALLFTYMLHLVADAHQPLHVCSAYGKEFAGFYSNSKNQKDIIDNVSSSSSSSSSLFSDRGGNFWCISEKPCKRRRRRRSSSGDGGNKDDSESKKEEVSCCRDSLHRFYDKIGGFSSEAELSRIVGHDATRGRAGTCAFAANHADTCEDLGFLHDDTECCLDNVAAELIQDATENGDDDFVSKLKIGLDHTDVDEWVRDEKLCKSVYTEKVAGKIIVDKEEVDGLVDKEGEPLVPGRPLSQNYKKWAQRMLKQRLVLAGYRLGFLLKELFEARMSASEIVDLGRVGGGGTDL